MNNSTFPSSHEEGHLYFITASISGWKPLFVKQSYADIILNCLNWMRSENRIKLFSFVIMPSHIHFINATMNSTIGNFLQQFGSFTAHRILYQLREEKETELIAFFQKQNTHPNHKHRIWQDIQAKNIYSNEYLEQKMEYIHNNPVNAGLISGQDRSKYLLSSACFYDRGKQPCVPVDDVYEFWF